MLSAKKLLASICAASMVLCSMAACGNNGSDSGNNAKNSKSANTTNSTSATSGKAVKLQLWLTPQWKGVFDPSETNADYDSFFKEAAKRYNDTHKDKPIELDVQVIPGDQRTEKLNVNLRSNTPPDIFFENTFAMGDFAHRGVLVPLDDIIDSTAKEDIDSSILDLGKFGKNTYFYPFMHNPGTLVYNADLFKKCGLEKYIKSADEIATWSLDDYNTILKTLKEKLPKGVYPMGLFAGNNQGDTWNLAYLRTYGNKFFSPESTVILNQDSGYKAMQRLVDIYKAGYTNPGAESVVSNDCNSMFQNQQLAISFTNPILFSNQQKDMKDGKAPKFDARIANIPGENHPLTFTYVTGSCIFDTKDQKRIDVAKEFVKFYSSDPKLVTASKNGVPVRKSVAKEFEKEKPLFKAYAENSKYTFNFSGNVPGYLQLRQVLFPEIQAALTGEKNAKQAVDSYTEKANKILEKSKKDSVVFK